MNKLIHSGLALILLVSHLHAGAPDVKERVGYRRLEKTDARATGVVGRLESFELKAVAIVDQEVVDALEMLRVGVVGEKRAGVINCLIRGGLDGQRVTIKADKINYAKAIDEICVQTGRIWKIEFLEPTGAPSLVIQEGNGPKGVR